MCGCLDKELTEFPLIKSRIYLCIMTTNARTRVAPKIILSFLYIPGLYYIISMGLIWTEREAQWEREREKAYLRHTQAHTQYAFECVIYTCSAVYVFSNATEFPAASPWVVALTASIGPFLCNIGQFWAPFLYYRH